MLHRWSGWPGAFCLDCGCDDPLELMLLNEDIDDDGLIPDEVMAKYKDHPGLQPCTKVSPK